MTVWVARLPVAAEALRRNGEWPLPFDGLPALSLLASAQECRRLLATLHPDKAPETLALEADRLWERFSALSPEDTVLAVAEGDELLLGRVSGPYRYAVQDGQDRHSVPVEWFSPAIKPARLGAYRRDVLAGQQPMQEITDRELRLKVLALLPHGHNPMARWKWIIGVVVVVKATGWLLVALHR
jgi:predicted Mrr-cat superfamily restriction endonuclease